ncbi:hypothetical protein RJ639_045598 [Escallonia herrerae]|uniref:Uncharacterized protein n=1 Tax=Escallonia herrerae TaxID=1293975 RepID=A0AA88W679_9ASTE|nr:hypothetical protein RJ639_045598 [Escallonia herrerae]
MMNQDLIKLDQFDGSNFGRWQDKVKFLLTTLRIVYILNCEPLSEPGDNASENEKKKWQRRNDDEVMCRGHILNALSDRLYNFYKSFDSAKEIWKVLEYKYKVQEEGTNKFLISEYNDFTMLDGIPILHQVHELQDIANKICELDGKLPESFQVGMIIAKLPPSWKDYRKKLLHREKKFTLEKIQKHLRIEDESRNRDKEGEAEFNSKVNYVDAASGKSFHALQVKKEDNMFKRNTNHYKNKKKKWKKPWVCDRCGATVTATVSSFLEEMLLVAVADGGGVRFRGGVGLYDV